MMCYDAANAKSFRGVPATNVLNGINFSRSDTNTSLVKSTNGTETVYIPALGYVTSKYVDFYNDYGGGSGECCPNLYSYGTGLPVSGSTTYTYSIIYKTATGYSHPNYMYRYEYNSSGGYVTESGVHSTTNRTSLGGDWWFAWGQFTTQATTATLNTYLFHYEYATYNRIYVYKAALYLGSTVMPAKHLLSPGEVRGSTVATGGGWKNLSGGTFEGEVFNGLAYNSDNDGALVFDGVNDYAQFNSATFTPYCLDFWLYNNNAVPDNDGAIGGPSTYQTLIHYPGGMISLGGWTGSATNEALHIWSFTGGGRLTYTRTAVPVGIHNWVFNWNGSHYDIWVDGAKQTVYAGSSGHALLSELTSAIKLGYDGSTYYFHGKIFSFKMYNAQLSDNNVRQNFSAVKRRFGL